MSRTMDLEFCSNASSSFSSKNPKIKVKSLKRSVSAANKTSNKQLTKGNELLNDQLKSKTSKYKKRRISESLRKLKDNIIHKSKFDVFATMSDENIKRKIKENPNATYDLKHSDFRDREAFQKGRRSIEDLLKNIQDQLKDKTLKLDEKEEQVRKLINENTHLNQIVQKHNTIDDAVSYFNNQCDLFVKDLETKLEIYAIQINEQDIKLKEIEEIKGKNATENKALKNIIKQMECSLKNKQSKVDNLNLKNKELRKIITENIEHANKDHLSILQNQIKEFNLTELKLIKELEELKTKAKQDQKTITDLSKYSQLYQTAKEESVQVKNLLENRKNELELLNNKYAIIYFDNEKLREQIGKAKEKHSLIIKDLQNLIDNKNNEINQINDRLVIQDKDLEERNNLIQTLEKELELLQSQITDFKNKNPADIHKNPEYVYEYSNTPISKTVDKFEQIYTLIQNKHEILTNLTKNIAQKIQILLSDIIGIKQNFYLSLNDPSTQIPELDTELDNIRVKLQRLDSLTKDFECQDTESNFLTTHLYNHFQTLTQQIDHLSQLQSPYSQNNQNSFQDSLEESARDMKEEAVRPKLREIDEETKDNLELSEEATQERDEKQKQFESELDYMKEVYNEHLTSLQYKIQKLEDKIHKLESDNSKLEDLNYDLKSSKARLEKQLESSNSDYTSLKNKEEALLEKEAQSQNRIYSLELELGQTKAFMFCKFEEKDNIIETLKQQIP